VLAKMPRSFSRVMVCLGVSPSTVKQTIPAESFSGRRVLAIGCQAKCIVAMGEMILTYSHVIMTMVRRRRQ
jgi:hypothetical protein